MSLRVEKILMTQEEADILTGLVKALNISGDIAEVGVAMGGSAEMICLAKGDTPLHLFDTFEGHPETTIYDPKEQQVGRHAYPLEKVKERLSKYPNVFYYKGTFPDTSGAVQGKEFSFVNLDTDLYEGTKFGLMFFYQRLVSGGAILIHDYPSISGVKKAVDEFGVPVKQISKNQGLIVKC